MKVAIPHWQGRVSPVFDVAGNVLLVDVDDGAERARQNLAMDQDQPQDRSALLRQQGATVLICGAISWPMELALSAAGIEVVSHRCGEVEQVLAAFIGGQLNENAFLMPGCCGRRRWGQGGQGGPAGRGGGRCRRRGGRGDSNA